MNKKIFMLDDDEKMCRLVETYLTKSGFEVKTRSGPSWPLLSDQELAKFEPDLVILDVMMPWFSGDTVADIFQTNVNKRPKIIFYSSKPEDELADLAEEKQVEGYVSKSEGPQALVEKIIEALAGD